MNGLFDRNNKIVIVSRKYVSNYIRMDTYQMFGMTHFTAKEPQ